MKKQFKLKELEINTNIEKGMFVYLIDGSSLTDEGGTQPYLIVNSYDIGDERILKEIPCKVLETGVEGFFAEGALNFVYMQDLKLMVGDKIFYISSAHVRVAMTKYSIPVTWESYKRYEVEAESLQEAAVKAVKQFLSEPDENYLEGSMNIDEIVEKETEEKIDFKRLNDVKTLLK